MRAYIYASCAQSVNCPENLWSFGIRSLCSRECGLYEASDILLGDHLCEKSATVKWHGGVITLGAHAQRGYGSWVCVSVCLSVT